MTQAYNLSQLANNLNTSGQLDATDGLVNAVPVANGGTGASSAAGAAANLATEFGKLLYPVGSLYFNATNSTNPGTLLGFGTWSAFGAGRVPVGFNASDPLFDTAEETGGSKDAIVVSHSHTASVSDPGHNHTISDVPTLQQDSGQYSAPAGNDDYPYQSRTSSSSTTGISVGISTTGSSGTNANLPPYITVYIWKRTA